MDLCFEEGAEIDLEEQDLGFKTEGKSQDCNNQA